MDDTLLSASNADTCKWCNRNISTTVFENANLCTECYQKATQAAQNPTLCKKCSSILTDPKVIKGLFSEYGLQHLVQDDLRLHAERGCELCQMFLLQDPNTDPRRLQFVPLFLVGKRPEEIKVKDTSGFSSAGDINSFYFSSETDQFSLELSVSAYEGEQKHVMQNLILTTGGLLDDPASKHISQRPPEPDLGSEHTNRQIRTWLDECIQKHPESLLDAELPHLPTRVLDVGTPENKYVKLFETSSDIRQHYLTLSYCWGTQRFLTTTSINLEAHREKLDFPTLPQTFQDAIITTRNLGFRYIWIDALCIIQDSNEDKAKEISRMGDIYNDSFLTIGVVAATRVADGFLKPKPQRGVTLPYRCPDGTMGSVRVAPQKMVDLWQESLYTRGWCLQENLLSRRLLLYTDTEVLWQCESAPMRRVNTTHVSYLYDLPKLRQSPFRRLPVDVLRAAVENNKENVDPAIEVERYNIWTSIVANYTRRRLTVGADRLPALSGIAQKFSKAWSDEYFAGHWKRQFVASLSWRRSRGTSDEYFPPVLEYRAPSWSWASIDGPVEFDFESNTASKKGLNAKLISVDFDLDVHSKKEDAAILEASLIPAEKIPHPNGLSGPGHSWYMDHDARITYLNEESLKETWCMLLNEGRVGSGKLIRATALVLRPEPDKSDCFYRAGLFTSNMKGISKLWANPKTRKEVKIL